ncbi:MAG: hypothetical protein NT118_15965, partial [Lentisphaerae bacterium]|nr:hypothetical protein [Lentisphaerota bacterium]
IDAHKESKRRKNMNTAMILGLAIIFAICLMAGFLAWLGYSLLIRAGVAVAVRNAYTGSP